MDLKKVRNLFIIFIDIYKTGGVRMRIKKALADFRTQLNHLPTDDESIGKRHQVDCLIFFVLFVLSTSIALIFRGVVQNPDLNITMFYMLGNFLVARYTTGYIFGFLYAILSVLTVNFLFTYPFYDFNLTIEGYPIAFVAMLTISLATSVLTTNMKKQALVLTQQEKELVEAQKEKMRANLLRAVSHDIRTPLTGIMGNSAYYLEMDDKLSKEEKREIVNNIENDANWLLNMVENLLTVTRINNDTETTVSKTLEAVDDVVSSANRRFKKRFPEAEVKIVLPDELIMVMMDAMLIEQVLINILQNAQMHAKSRKPIEVTVSEDDRNVIFQIKDYGIGIDPSKLESIFDGEGSYEKSAKSDGNKGMGIGLSICKTIVLAHGGKIKAENHGEGSMFTFSLPKETEE